MDYGSRSIGLCRIRPPLQSQFWFEQIPFHLFELATTTIDECTFAALGRFQGEWGWQGRAFLCRDPHVQLLIRTYPPGLAFDLRITFLAHR